MKKIIRRIGKKLIFAIPVLVLLLPFIVDKIYNLNPPLAFFNISYKSEDVLIYYGSALSFLGTLVLGCLTLKQNKLAQEKSDELNRLQLEVQRRSMALAEAEYSKNEEDQHPIPKFEIELKLMQGSYSNISLRLKNVASFIASCISPIDLIAKTSDDNEFAKAKKLSINLHSLSPGQETIVQTDLPALINEKDNRKPYTNVQLIFSFSCEDEKSKTHYFKATLFIQNTSKAIHTPWAIDKVG